MMRAVLAASAAVVVATIAILLAVSPPDFLSSSSPSASPSPSPLETTRSPTATETPRPVEEDKLLARLAVAGDTGMRNAAVRVTAKAMQIESERDGNPYDALIIPGDMVYPDGEANLTEESVIEPFAEILDGAELVPVLGNHDVQSGEGRQIMRRLGRDSAWYVEWIGPVRLLVLDSNRVGEPRQMAWLREEAAKEQQRRTWTIPVMHHPPYSAGSHGSTKSVQRRWLPLFERAGVRLTLAGHDHDYQRSVPLKGMTHVISGGGSKLRPTGRKDFTAFSASVLHYLDLLIYKDRIEGRAIDHDGNVLDDFKIRR
jgi:3',5'-cyclic AMP phosphodiesterase CpdA